MIRQNNKLAIAKGARVVASPSFSPQYADFFPGLFASEPKNDFSFGIGKKISASETSGATSMNEGLAGKLARPDISVS